MCGIIGYVGNKQPTSLLIEGLRRLEYRGYDSAGICVQKNNQLEIIKQKGKVSDLARETKKLKNTNSLGIAHTRWATHGKPNQVNAHPHTDCTNQLAIVHNGIVENYKALKEMLTAQGHQFKSETDSEIIAHLIEEFTKKAQPLEESVRAALKCVEGTFGLAVISNKKNKLIAARRGSPLVIGVGEQEMFVASDVSAIMKHTKDVVYLGENELATIEQNSYKVRDLNGNHVGKEIKKIQWSLEQIEKGGHKYFMEKEIFEQPKAVENNLRGRLHKEQIKLSVEIDTAKMEKIIIAACGTSWHAALIGKYLLEEIVRIPVEVDYASELRYRNPIINENTLFIPISQSGETADTLAALQEAKQKEAQTLGIVNVVGSTIAREVGSGIYLHAGPEIGVASTKAFTTELSSLTLLALHLYKNARSTKKGKKFFENMTQELSTIPEKMKKVLNNTDAIKETAKYYKDKHDFLFLSRGINYPTALEGALKLKELSYAHAEGYPAAEMKHGPIALIEKGTPVVFIATTSNTLPKTISNMEEIVSRGGDVIAVVDEKTESKVGNLAAYKFLVPQTDKLLSPLLNVLPLQLLAYYLADLRNLNVDKPRNLAKSVTVE